MAVNTADEDSVLISLSTNSPTSITQPERRIVLTPSQPTLKIGRSSNRSSLALTPNLNNGYFDSPVMSREHAEIEADIPRQMIRIRDAGSMHGTYLNDHQLDTEQARPLAAGDQITFGLPVYRNQKTFQPATITVGMEFRHAGQADHSPSRVFTVPDDCSTDENEPLEDNVPQKIPTYISEQEMNPWQEAVDDNPRRMGQVDGVIEIESEPESDAYFHEHISISSSDGEEDDMDIEEAGGFNDNGPDDDDDDNESISLTDDEQTSSAPASPIESIDLDDPVLGDNDGTRSPSWNSVSTDPYSEHMEEQPPSVHNSEDEQGVFLYDTESEEMDETGPVGFEFSYGEHLVDHQSPSSAPQSTHPVHTAHPVLPSISTAVFSQPFTPVMPFGYQLAPVMQPAPRHPSPSDAVLPLSRRHHGSEDDCGITVESLGRKSGKTDFFEAREQNKISVASSGAYPHPEFNSVVAASKTTIEEGTFRPSTEILSDCPASSSTEAGKHSAVASFREAFPVLSLLQATQPALGSEALQTSQGPVQSQGNRALEDSKSSFGHPLLNSGEAFLNAPLKTFEVGPKATEDVDLGWTAKSADELFQMKQSAQIRADRPSEWNLYSPEAPNAAERSKEPKKDTTTGKRKAAGISETTNQELVWHEQSAADQQPAPSSPFTAQPEIETDLSKLSFHTAPEEESTAVRPAKIRKIAERVGYAALGGATVGAMVLTSLIYTAPNFA